MTECSLPEQHLETVLFPFTTQIEGFKLKVFINVINRPIQNLVADWQNYKLVVFNVLQNAIKYNSYKGHIVVLIEFKPSLGMDPNQLIMETNVIDTGIGISKDRQKMLFKPFLELKVK